MQIDGVSLYDMTWGDLVGSSEPEYEGNYWPYVYVNEEVTINDGVQANISTSDNGHLLVDGYPVYQYLGDETASDWNGAYVGATIVEWSPATPADLVGTYSRIPWEPVQPSEQSVIIEPTEPNQPDQVEPDSIEPIVNNAPQISSSNEVKIELINEILKSDTIISFETTPQDMSSNGRS